MNVFLMSGWHCWCFESMPMIYKLGCLHQNHIILVNANFHVLPIASCYTLVVLFLCPSKLWWDFDIHYHFIEITRGLVPEHIEKFIMSKLFLGSSNYGSLLLFDGTKESGEYNFKMLNLRGMVQCLLMALWFTTFKFVTYVCNIHVNKYFHFFFSLLPFAYEPI